MLMANSAFKSIFSNLRPCLLEDQGVSKTQFDALQKQCSDLSEKNKQLLDDVDCTRTDRERKQEEMDQLRGQLDKLRAEKNANGAAKSAKKTKK